MEQLEKENQALRAQLEEARGALTAAHIQSSITSLQSPSRSAAIITLDIASNPVDDSLNAIDGCQLGLDEEDLRCLEPGSPLTDKVINAVLRLLGSLAPLTIITVDSSAHEITLSDWLQPVDQYNKQTILVPIHILPSGHWLLAVRDSNGARLLDSLPIDDHKQSAEERINTMFCRQPTCWPSSETMEEIKYTNQETDSVDSGVAVLVKAIYIVAAALGNEQPLPQTLDAELWRQALLMLLKVAMGQTYDLGWADGLEGNNVLLEQGAPNEMQMLWYPGPGPIDHQVATQSIESQLQFLMQQRQRVQEAIDQKMEMKAAASRIYSILSSLLQSATLQKEQVQMLTTEKMNYIKSLNLFAELEELSRASSFRKVPAMDTRPQDLEKRLGEVTTCLAYRERMVATLNEVHRAWSEDLNSMSDS